MVALAKKHEMVVVPTFKNGVSLQFFTIDFGADVSALLDADLTNVNTRSPVVVALEAIAQVASIEIIGTLGGEGSNTLPIAVAALGGDFGTAKWDGSNSETFDAHLEDLVRACGTHQGVNLGNATVTTGATFA